MGMEWRRLLGSVLFVVAISCDATSWAQPPSVKTPEAINGVYVEKDVMLVARDGTKLAADVYHPAEDGKAMEGRFPTLLTRTPYSKDGSGSEGRYYAERGYNVVVNDVRGRYKSDGTWRLMADDPNDGYDVVEWIAKQTWSDGKVGTFGTSYPGGTQHALAEMNPPHLTTMIPVDALSNCGVSGMRQGGAFELRFMNWIFNLGAPNSKAALENPLLRTALQENGRRIREHVDSLPFHLGTTPLRAVPEYEAWLYKALRSGPESDFWKIKGMSVVDHVADYADVPVLHITGWYDSWTRQAAMNYGALSKVKKSPQYLTIGPWIHGGQTSSISGEVEFTADAAIDLLAYRLKWYKCFINGDTELFAKEPHVWIYVMGSGDDSKSDAGRLKHGGSWRGEDEWPLKRAKRTTYFLQGDGMLDPKPPKQTESSTTYTFDPKHPVPTVGGNISSNPPLMTNGGYDQRSREDTHAAGNRLPLSERPDVLMYQTVPLCEDLEVTGTVEVILWIKSTAVDTDFTAKLIDEIPPNADYPLGFSLNLGDSIIRARYRESLDRPSLMTPGEAVPLTITLYPTSNVFKKGHRIRVDISSSNYPRFDVNPNTGDPLGIARTFRIAENTVFHEAGHPSQVILPVVPRVPVVGESSLKP